MKKMLICINDVYTTSNDGLVLKKVYVLYQFSTFLMFSLIFANMQIKYM